MQNVMGGARINMAAMKREFARMQNDRKSITYRGFVVEQLGKRWSVVGWSKLYTSEAKAREAVDRCLDLRAMPAEV